jgi:hypothetical protein
MRSTLLLILPLFAACDVAPTGPLVEPPPSYPMTGAWTMTVTFGGTFVFDGDSTTYVISCAGPATATMQQTSGALSGTVAGALDCVFTGNPGTYDVSGTVTGKRYGGGTMGWSAGRCSYTGSTPTPSAAEGGVVCDQEVPGGAVAHVSGTWSATRK